MEQKTKYDTNPLDPEFERRANDDWGPQRSDTGDTARVEEVTADIRKGRNTAGPEHDAPTRRYDAGAAPSYPSVFVPPTYAPPATHGQQQYPLTVGPPSSRPVSGLHLPENITMILPYAPAYIGVVAAVIELYLVPRSELRVRFHAAQGLALQLAITAISLLFGAIGMITGSYSGKSIFWLASNIFLIISMIRVWKGRSHHIAPLDEATKWLNEHVQSKRP
jgi:uncharacterized membrane protein